MIASTLSIIVSISVFSLLIAAALSPIESLSWWAGWNDADAADATPVEIEQTTPAHADRRFIIYLSGISTMAGHYLADQEARFLATLKAHVPDAEIISDIFPYSPSGAPLLASPRLLDKVWRRLLAMRLKGRGAMSALANLRNFFQVLVSADHRYGPIFNLGAAQVIADALERHGYPKGEGAPVTIIGFSGGAQVGLGAAPFLKPALGAPIDLIAIGGVMSSDPGIKSVRAIHRLYGARDGVHKLGAIFFPERWRIFSYSQWNKARRSGKVVAKNIGAMKHSGPRGYFGLQRYDETRRYVDDTVTAVIDALRQKSETAAPR